MYGGAAREALLILTLGSAACLGPSRALIAEPQPGAGTEARVPLGDAVWPGLHLAPNVFDTDGTPAYVHFSERARPLVVELPLPELPARDSTPEQTREAVASAFRDWERALQLVQPEFRLAFSERHANPDLRAVWTKRPPAALPARGSIGYQVAEEAGQQVLRVSAAITLSTQPLPGARHRVSLGELRAHALHAFGSALGLADCRGCDSIMSDAWGRRRKKEVTDLDLLTYEALIGLPNGVRRDGRRMRALEGDTAVVGTREQEPGVLADLPFINTGRGGTPYIDLAAPGKRSFTLALDTGATDTILTDAYARALGISVRATKADRYRRSTITGRSLEFWCMGQRVVGGGRGPTHFDYALLGGRFLENFVVGIDFGARRVRFLDPGVHRVDDEDSGNSEERVIDLRISESRPYAELRVGDESVWALVDTGAEANLILSEEAARKLEIEIDPDAERVRMRNVLGTQVTVRQRLARARLGPFELENIELQISLAEESSVRIERWLHGEAIIGVRLLEKFRVRIDYPRAKLGLSPTRPTRPPAEPERDAIPGAGGKGASLEPELELPDRRTGRLSRTPSTRSTKIGEIRIDEASMRNRGFLVTRAPLVRHLPLSGVPGYPRLHAGGCSCVYDSGGGSA